MCTRSSAVLLGVWLSTVSSLPAAQTTGLPTRDGATGYVGDEAQRKLGEPLPPGPGPAPTGIDPSRTNGLPRPATERAVVIPRENCGTFWTGWVNDPSADVNPCPANCKRGERVQINQHKSGNITQYEAKYECYLPQLEIRPAPGARQLPAAGATPRKNCGTVWTGWKSDPHADVNPCPANCERGELRRVNRNRSGDKLLYDMNYQCYVREPAAEKAAAAHEKPKPAGGIRNRTHETLRPKIIATEPIRLSGTRPAPLLVSAAQIQLTGTRVPPTFITTPQIRLTGTRP